MNVNYQREYAMDPHHTGYLGTSRVVLNHFDVSTQANIEHAALAYESEDEIMGRLHNNRTRGTPHYSKLDIREQYCISERGLGALESDKQSLFGCLSSHHQSPCSSRSSFLTACVKQKVPSDENLYELHKKHPSEYAPYPRRSRNVWGPVTPEMRGYDEHLNSSYFRRKVVVDPSRYTWMPLDDESVRMEIPRPIVENNFHHPPVHINESLNLPSKKHVSFARSHTMASFDDAVSSLSSSTSQLHRMSRSQERLLDIRKNEAQPVTKQPEPEIFLDKLKRAPMKTQATQTEAGLGRKPLPPSRINLSPRTIHRVKMVSQGAQTNGFLVNGRMLTKSYSEAGSKFGLPERKDDFQPFESISDHEPLQRTQSDEPPRSPFILNAPPLFNIPEPIQQIPHSDNSSLSKSDHGSEDSTESKKEIFIDFKPQISSITGKPIKRILTKTLSDGEILLERRKGHKNDDREVPSESFTSISHDNISIEEKEHSFVSYSHKPHIYNEGICKAFDDTMYRPLAIGMYGPDSIEDEFHENLLYNSLFNNEEADYDDEDERINDLMQDECIVPSVCLLPEQQLSPFTSNDSLNIDARDQSDGIWNESQVTVLQVDSGTDNGTALSSSEVTSATSPASTTLLLTPSSRRKHLLMLQHQQCSSMDIDALDEEVVDHSELYPRIVIDKTAKHLESPVSTSRQYLSIHNSIPVRKRPQESPVESPLPAVVPDLLLTRTDSCKTNTDVSESTTTDDYITATSGTDSSRKSFSLKGIDKSSHFPLHTNDGSSLESSKGIDLFGDDMTVPSCSPSRPTSSSSRSLCHTPVPEIRCKVGRSTPSEDSSSSCGSYSVAGSTPDLLLDRHTTVPSGSHGKLSRPISEDDKSVRHSSSGYYESPMEDDLTWKSTEHDIAKKRKDFTLHLSKHSKSNSESYSFSNNSKYKTSKRELKGSPSSETNKATEKPKRSKTRMRSPMQNHKKSLLKKPFHGSAYLEESENKGTSDESSCDLCVKPISSQTSPRKSKKNKENSRRKSLPRSPVSQRLSNRNECDEKTTSLPGSLTRRRSSKQLQAMSDDIRSRGLSPGGSPSGPSCQNQRKNMETTKLKALSAESLRSVSPGSDSVFYSDPSSHTLEGQVHCLHCGKEVDIVTTDDPDKSISSNEIHQDIVQPPVGFEDSPRIKTKERLFKKLDRKLRTEERTQAENRKKRHDIRAKSEERATKAYRSKLRPMAKSTNSSQEQLKSTDSSPSILPGEPEDENDTGVYYVPYIDGFWIYIDERDDFKSSSSFSSPTEQGSHRRLSISSTESEQDFRKKYQAVKHRMVHRKSCLEMYKRQNSRSFECDKTVLVHRDSGEFGFRIHGSKPVVVSAIEPGTPAETSGLEVGDIVLAVNGISVLDKSHSEVVKLAHAGCDTLKLEVARTCYALNSPKDECTLNILYNGYLWKLSGYASGTTTNKWIRRWFCLKQNNCLYYYKTDNDNQPVGVMMLLGNEIKKQNEHDNDLSKQNRFVIQRPDAVPLYLAADNAAAQERWIEVIDKAINDSKIEDEFLETTKRNLILPPNAVQNPDCFGYLVKLGTQWKSWSKRYCVLKDACLYFYTDASAKMAFGVACLHGYRVQQSLTGFKKHAFEIMPPDSNKKQFYFHAESEADRKRWIAALEYSIDRWLKVQ